MVSVQFSSVAQSCLTLWPHGLQHTRLPCPLPTPRVCSNLSVMMKSVMPSNHLILCCPLLLPSIFPSTRVFSNESALCIRWPKYWSFSFNISPSNEHLGPISRVLISLPSWLNHLPKAASLNNLTLGNSVFESEWTHQTIAITIDQNES